MNPVYLLDTNVVSEFSKPFQNKNVIASMNAYADICAISSITLQELVHGVSRLPDGRKKEYIQGIIDNIRENFPVIGYDAFSAKICGEVQSKCEEKGKTMQYFDAQIAATALAHGMILVTHNTKDFEAFRDNSALNIVDWYNER